MPRFRKRPVEVEAVQWLGDNWGDMLDFVIAGGGSAHTQGELLMIETLEGMMAAKPSAWVIRGVAGEFYLCAPTIFAKTYERV